VTAAELSEFSGAIFDKIDRDKAGKVAVADLRARLFFTMLSAGGPRAMGAMMGGPGKPGRDYEVGTWPEFNKMIGGYFKYHWLDPQHIVYKIDDPSNPINAAFRDKGFEVNDETYTFAANSWSRRNLHVLTSIDYSKMSDADKAKEDFPREDHDYGLSWIRREGKGRVFYSAHGHNERIYAITPMLEHLLAGIQYALGDLKANDAPAAK
jgi:type 1 glutamine amidotransferase